MEQMSLVILENIHWQQFLRRCVYTCYCEVFISGAVESREHCDHAESIRCSRLERREWTGLNIQSSICEKLWIYPIHFEKVVPVFILSLPRQGYAGHRAFSHIDQRQHWGNWKYTQHVSMWIHFKCRKKLWIEAF